MSKKFNLKKIAPLIKLGKTFDTSISEIEILHAGEWDHASYGNIKIDESDIDQFIQSFDDKVRKVDIAVDQEHMPEKGAAGWYKSLKKVFEDGKTKLKATIEWTSLGKQLINDGVFKYFSPEFDFIYEDPETHEEFENVLIGGGLTNRPYFKSLAPVKLSENMYAGFISKSNLRGGENTVNKKDELKAKLAEDSEFVLANDATDEDKTAYGEAKEEIAKEAEKNNDGDSSDDGDDDSDDGDKGGDKDGDGDDGDSDDDSQKMSEKFIAKADHTKQMNELKTRLGVSERKLRFKEVQAEVDGFVFSESNANGVLLPKNKEVAVKILMASNTKVAGLFSEFLKGLPKVSAKLFQEEGGGDEDVANSNKVQTEAVKLMEKDGMTYAEAVKTVGSKNPDLLKE